MRKKIVNILICVMMVITTFFVFKEISNVKAGLGEEDEENVGLNYDFIYEVIRELSEIIFDDNYAKDHGIWKGRTFGTDGEREAMDKIRNWIIENTDNLTSSYTVERVGDESYGISDLNMMRKVNNKMEILGYYVDLREGYLGDPDVIIPNNESFVFPKKTYWWDWFEHTVDSGGPVKIHWPPIGGEENPQDGEDVDFNAFNLNVTKYNASFTLLNSSGSLVAGNVTYLEDYSNATTQEKAGKIHLINVSDEEYNSTVEMLENDNATGFVLIRDNVIDIKEWMINIPGVAVSQENGSFLMNLSQNGIVDVFCSDYNLSTNTGTLNIYHCTDNITCFEKEIYMVNATWLENRYDVFLDEMKSLRFIAKGFLLCSPDYPQSHFQYPYSNLREGIHASYSRLMLPMISVNGSVIINGEMKDVWEWVEENNGTEHPVTLNFSILQRKNPEVESYNIYCDVEGKNSDDTFIMSGGHYDGWYGQATCDNAVGIAQMLGILKYFNDNNIIPRYTTRFIFHAGEENVARGSMSHVFNMSNRDFLQNAKYIINLCQLGHKYPASFRINTTKLLFQPILEKITNYSNYDEKYGDNNYQVRIGGKQSNGTVDCVPYARYYNNIIINPVNLKYVNFCKDNYPLYHRTGINHTVGDTMDALDVDDINATVDIIWNVTKYFIVDPDCWFENIDHELVDSPDDENTFPDTVNISYSIKTCMPQDRVMIRAILFAKAQDGHPAFPIRYRYMEKKICTVTHSGVEDYIIIDLPKNAPKGDYNLYVFLYNSSGEINNVLEKFDTGIFANDTYLKFDLNMHPPNDPPEKPETPDGDPEVHAYETDIYSTSTWDHNEDRFRYQWKWRQSSNPLWWTLFTKANNETHYRLHTWWPPIADDAEVRVRAKDTHNSPNVMSNWSDPLAVTMSQGCIFSAPTATIVYQSTKFTAMSYGLSEPLTYSWDFTESRGYTAGYPIHNYTYNSTSDYVVKLKVTDDNGVEVFYNRSIRVDYIVANFTNTPISVQPDEIMCFNDTSLTYNGSHIVNWTWDFDDGNISYTQNTTHTYLEAGEYNVSLTVTDNQSYNDICYKIIYVDCVPPDILYSTYSPYFIVCGSNVTIYADFYDNQSGVKTAKVNITSPDNSSGNFTMYNSENSMYDYEYIFNDTWQDGKYNITIWVQDHANNSNSTTGYWFDVSPMSPDNDAVNVTTNPTLSVYINDPNDEAVNVSFYEWTPNSVIIDNENDWDEGSFTNTTTDGNGNLQLMNDTSIYGDGSDGNVTIPSGTTTLTGDMNYYNLTIPYGRTLNTAGYTVYVSGTLLNYGTIIDSSSGGSGGAYGDGGSGQDPWGNSGGPSMPDDGECGDVVSGRGGDGGAGGAGGGGAKSKRTTWPYEEIDADGGTGGDGGDGGTGGGEVCIFAYSLDNQGTIHADGDDGDDGEDGSIGEYYDWPVTPLRDLAGGGGGGGTGGAGGDGGFVNLTYSVLVNLNEEDIHASGGNGGSHGSRGGRYYLVKAGYTGWDWWTYNGGDGCDGGPDGDGGYGEYEQYAYSGYGSDGADGSNGEQGQVTLTYNQYVPSGSYSKILDAGVVVGWSNIILDQTTPEETSITVSYGENTSDSWSYYDDLSSVPDCRWLKVILTLSTSNYSASPVVDSVNMSSCRYLLDTVSNVSDGSYAEYNWTGLDHNTLYYWQVRLFNEISSSYGPVWGFSTIEDDIFEISSVYGSPDPVGFGFNVSIGANVTCNYGNISEVKVNISYPDDSSSNLTMSNIGGDTYEYVFNDTWLTDQYNYTIWAFNNISNSTSSSGHSFNVSAEATINVATLKDTYGAGEYINITDPPAVPENYILTSRGLDYNKYYNAVSGNDVLEVYTGPVNYQDENEEWTPINATIEMLDSDHPAYSYGYRAGNNKGLYSTYFKPNIDSDWPVAFAYDKSDDPITHVVRSKLVGVGYLDPSSDWDYEYLQNAQSSTGQIEDNSVTYEDVFTGTDVKWSYGSSGLKEDIIMDTDAETMLTNNPPSDYGLSNSESYLVFITKLDYQGLTMYDESGDLTGNVTITENGVDFKDVLGDFKCALPIGVAYEQNNPIESTELTYRIIQYNGNYYLLSGLKVIDLNDMTFPVVVDPTLTTYSSSSDGYIMKSNSDYNTAWNSSTGTVYDSYSYFYIGQREPPLGFPPPKQIFRGFVFFNTSSIPSNMAITSATLSLYKYGDYSTTDFDITVQNGQPTYPHDPLVSGDYDKDHYSGNGGSMNTSGFSNGYNDISLTNYSWINEDSWTKLCLRSNRDINAIAPSNNEYVKIRSHEYPIMSGPKLVIEYRNQSKIKNTGSTNISGYLFMSVEYYDGDGEPGEWILDTVVINETTPRTINIGEQLALDLIFNGEINTDDLVNGDGTYRVYAAFRDEYGDVLICDDETALEAWYEFTVDTS